MPWRGPLLIGEGEQLAFAAGEVRHLEIVITPGVASIDADGRISELDDDGLLLLFPGTILHAESLSVHCQKFKNPR